MSTGINIVICILIGAFGVAVLVKLLSSAGNLERLLERFNEINKVSNSYDESIEGEGDIVTRGYSENKIDRNLLEKTRESYYREYASYVVMSQLIALFPLLGIFGTVLGLIMGDISDLDTMLGGLSMAMWTTLVGLVCSIILKAIDAVAVGKRVNLIDAEFEKADSVINRQLIKSEISKATIKTV